ncbi:MAG TPA: hypothetical protein VHF22_11155, partial [Planctomycetota bacterium]|nr:hypothetical protein [Planctomycetota bacterium]
MHARSLALAALTLCLPAAALLGCRNRSSNTPIAIIGTPLNAGGRAVPVSYLLRNQDTTSVDVFVLYSTDGGRTYQGATAAPGGEGTTSLSASPGGTTHVYLWNALADLGPGRQPSVLLQIIPKIGADAGDFASSFFFTVDNTDIFVREADLATTRGRSAAAALPEGGAIVAGGGGLSGETEAFVSPASVETRAAIGTLREDAVAETVAVARGAGVEPEPVLVAGRGLGGVTLTSAEIYSSGLDAWLTLAGGVGARTGHTVTRL